MSCPTCHAELPSTTRFCPGCGSPGQVAVDTEGIDLGPETAAMPAEDLDPYPAELDGSAPSATARPTAVTGATTVLASRPEAPAGPSLGDRVGPVADVARDRARHWAGRFERLPVDVRVSIVGATIAVISFLFLPYTAGFGAPVETSGRYWWRPIIAVAATVLLAASLGRAQRPSTGTEVPRRTDGLLSAVVLAAAGVGEAGLLGLLAGDVVKPRAGFYGMLLGLVIVLVAAVRAARRTLR